MIGWSKMNERLPDMFLYEILLNVIVWPEKILKKIQEICRIHIIEVIYFALYSFGNNYQKII